MSATVLQFPRIEHPPVTGAVAEALYWVAVQEQKARATTNLEWRDVLYTAALRTRDSLSERIGRRIAIPIEHFI